MPWFEYPPLFALGKTDLRGKRPPFDVIVVSGDAFVDHPSFPAAVIVRVLQAKGLSVGVIAQPGWTGIDDLKVFGRPNLFFAVSAGAMDSMVANFTSMKFPRKTDRLSPGGKPGLRPKRAVQVYTNRIREAFPDVPIVIGGIEASLRRFSHFDFWEDRVRDPILFDAPADILVYGMGESVLGRLVDAFSKGGWTRRDGFGAMIPQTCVRLARGRAAEFVQGKEVAVLPSADECRSSRPAFMKLAAIFDGSNAPGRPLLVQSHPKGEVLCFPPEESDWIEEPMAFGKLGFNRRSHPLYDEQIPAIVPVQFSVSSHRGCVGMCTFCALGAHEGRRIRSRSIENILQEIERFPSHPDFRGTVPDVGGPSVNMFGWDFPRSGKEPPGLSHLAELLDRAAEIPGVKHVFLGSGLRFDLLRPGDDPFLKRILSSHVSGQLKVAPEHVDRSVLKLMRKGPDADFPAFVERFRRLVEGTGKKLFLVPYFMTAFPGSAGLDGFLDDLVRRLRLVHEQIQEFTPTPSTLATAMFHCLSDLEGNPISVPRKHGERKSGRSILHRKDRT